MLPKRMDELALKKRMLRQRSAVLRRAFAEQVLQGVAPALGVADRVISAGQWLKRHPVWLIVPVVALLVWRPKVAASGLAIGLTRWAGRGMWLWQTWAKLQPVVEAMRQRSIGHQRDRL